MHLYKPVLVSLALGAAAQAHPHRGERPQPAPPALVQARLGDNLTLTRQGWHRDVVLDSNTRFYEGRYEDPGVRDRLSAGDAVDVRDHLQADGRNHAVAVHVHRGHPVHGKILSRDSSGFLVNFHGDPVRVNVTSSTRYHMGWLPAAAWMLDEGGRVEVQGARTGVAVQANHVELPFPWMQLGAGFCLAAAAGVLAHRRRKPRPRPRPRIDD